MNATDAIGIAEKMETLGLNGVLFLLLCAFGYVIYRFIIKEHKQIIELSDKTLAAFDAINDKLSLQNLALDKTNVLSDASTSALAKSADKAFDLAEKSREETLKILNGMNGKLDRLLASASPRARVKRSE
jgi:hypothetical protein